MTNKVFEFLKNYRVGAQGDYNFVSMGDDFQGKFLLDKNQIKEFTKIYAEAVEKGSVFNIAEKPKEYGPLLIDLDLEILKTNHNGERLYDNNLIYKVIDTYREATCEYLDLSAEELTASVFEKPKPTEKPKIIKDGVHIIFHGIVAHYKLRYLIRDKVVQILNNCQIFKKYENSVEKIFDKAVINTNCWLLPGSRKKDGQLYELKYIYDQNNKPIDITKILSDKYKIIKLYSLQNKLRCEKNKTTYLKNVTFEEIEEEFLKINEKPSKNANDDKNNNDNDKNDIIKCLQCININDYNDYEKWRDIALIINNELGLNGFNILNEWSKNGENYDEEAVKKFYYNIKPKSNGLKIGTLKKIAKESNLELYTKLISKNKINETKKEEEINYNNIKIEFEKNNFKILNPIMFATINRNNELIMRSKKDFKDVYENLTYEKYDIQTNSFSDASFIDKWLKDSAIRTYDNIDFLPKQKEPEYVYNTFKNFEAENKQLIKTDIENSNIIKHIKNLCNNSEEVFNYVIKFLARKVQKPNKLTNTALIFKSNEGAGKDIFFNWFGNKIIGSNYYCNTEKPELLFGKFTSALENKILIIVNETSGKDTFSINENIKCAITAQYNMIEHKGLNPYKNSNHISYIFLTNNDNPIKVSADDRRFCGIECNNLICNNKEYFNLLYNELNKGEYDKAFYDYLINIDCDDYDFTNNRPKTNYYNDLQELNKPVLINFIEDFIIKNNYKNAEKIVEISSGNLYNNFMEYNNKFNFKSQISLTKFIMDLKKLDGIDNKRTRTQRLITLDINKIKMYLFNKYKVEFSNIEDDEAEEEKSPLDF